MKKTMSLEDLVNQLSWLTKEQKEAFYRSVTGLTVDDANILFDEQGNIKCVQFIDSMKTLDIKLNIVPVIGELN